MASLCRISGHNEHSTFVLAPFEDDDQESSGAGMPDPFPSAAVGWLNRHPKLKYLLNLSHSNLWMPLSKVDLSISFPRKDKSHGKILTW
jgi:hypothetical protein